MTAAAWPSVELDAVARMRILAAGLPYVALAERLIDAPFDAVWNVAGDLVNGVPRFERDVKNLEILEQRDDQLRLVAEGSLGVRVRFDATLRPGWCVMRSRWADIGMAATAVSTERTLFAHFEGSRWLGRPGRRLFERFVTGDLERLARLVEHPAQENTT